MADSVIVSRPRLVVTMLGSPRDVLKMEAKDASMLVGTIYGIAEKTRMKPTTDRDGTPRDMEVIVGTFEGIPAKPTKDTLPGSKTEVDVKAYRTSTLLLPEGIHENVVAQFKRDPTPFHFGVELHAHKSENGKSFNWKTVVKIAPAVADPLAAMRATILGDGEKKPATAGKK